MSVEELVRLQIEPAIAARIKEIEASRQRFAQRSRVSVSEVKLCIHPPDLRIPYGLTVKI